MSNLPTGTVTFLFTDIEGSTKLWEQQASTMKEALQRHDTLLREAMEANGGYVFKTVGDAFCAAFSTPLSALEAALVMQTRLMTELPDIKVRAALHTGMSEERGGDYFGPTLNRVARLLSAGHGGQSLLSGPAYDLVRDYLPNGVSLLDMGEHRLKDLLRPEHIFQLVLPDYPSDFPPLRTLDARPNNLPPQPTLFIGREAELHSISTLLRRLEVRLVSLTGPGGTGKTRLSLQAAADMLDDFADGVWFVGLAALTDHNLVASTIADVLGVKESAGQPLLETLKTALSAKNLLLVLDNFEQVMEAAALVSTLLKAAPSIKVLATSRMRLNLYGEKEFPVPPLSLPDTRQGHLPTLDRLAQYEAVRLFIERAQDSKPHFAVTNDNAPAVAEICVRLDGLPLAIELAAARVRLFPPQVLLGRLSSRLKLLTGGARDLAARQQTLRGTIDWSYDLLEKGEKQFFRRMAVFQGGRTLEALEAVCNPDGTLQVDVVEGVESLLGKNLLQQREGLDGEPRFWMLETIHEYAREKLGESGEAAAFQREHALYFMRLAEEAEPHLTGAKQAKWLDTLEDEHDNIRATLRWARETGQADDIEIGLRTAGAIWRFWDVRGYYSEGREQLGRVLSADAHLALSDSHVPYRQSKAKALNGAGGLAYVQGEPIAARALLEEALSIGREVGDKQSMGLSLNMLGNVALWLEGPAEARPLYEESLLLKRELGDIRGISTTLTNLGNVALWQGDYESAQIMYEESLALARQVGDQLGIRHTLGCLGSIAADQGNYTAARALYEESLLLARELGDKAGVAGALYDLGSLDIQESNYEGAHSRYEESLVIEQELGGKLNFASGGLAGVALMQKDYEKARALYSQGLMIFKEAGHKAGIIESIAGLGAVASVTTGAEHGAKIIGAAEMLNELTVSIMYPVLRLICEQGLSSARAQLSEEAFEKAHQEGRAMSMEEAIEYALAES